MEFDSSIHTDNSSFHNLLEIFGQVVEYTSLLCKPSSPLSNLSEVPFSRRESIFQDDLYPISLYWRIKNGDKAILLIKPDIVSIPFGPIEIVTETFVFVKNENGL